MRLSEIISSYPCKVKGDLSAEISGLEYDSRRAGAGTLFFCMRGANVDGHRFAKSAYDRGCRNFVCEYILELPDDAVQITVNDSRSALPYYSANFFGNPAKSLKIIGITGTKGKTTTSLLTSAIINGAGKKCAYIGGNGIIFGGKHFETVNTTPESRDLHGYFRMMVDDGVEYVAMEVSSQALAHHRVDGIDFDTAVFLNLASDHISDSEHPTFENYRYSKSRMFTSEHTPKFVVYNKDDEYSDGIICASDAPKVSFSVENPAADYFGADIVPYRDRYSLGVSFELMSHNKTRFSLRSPGSFSVSNALAAIAICSHYGIEPDRSADVLSHTSVMGRCEIVEGLPGRTFILDYAHNGFSLTNTLNVLRKYSPNKLICVFGSIGGRAEGRRAELAHASSTLADYSIITSDNPDFENPEAIIADIVAGFDGDSEYEVIPDREEAVRRAVRISEVGDIVLFAGKGHETYQIIKGVHEPFSEKEIIRDECNRILV